MKKCCICGEMKTLSAFGAGGTRMECRKCGTLLAKEHRQRVRLGWIVGQYTRPEAKRCRKCRQILPASRFNETDQNTSGLSAYCNDCNKKLFFEYRRTRLRNYLLVRAKGRAKRLGLAFDLTLDDINIPDRCPALGIELYVSDGLGPSDNSPSIDRIDNTQGYIRGNVVIVSNLVNRVKTNATVDQLVAIANFYKRLQEKSAK